ncbi:MAG TPA: alpha/beta fold hydrolase [Myxococcales bacterium]|nr:alpha/beta fold hydrolase [Myxococcales bacterium]
MLLFLAALAVSEGNFVVKDFRFASGETLPEVRLHYRTLGSPQNPAVLILHGTTGTGTQFLNDIFAGALFGPGQLLDTGRYFVILPDGVGHGGSSKPSDGLRAKFPHYAYADMVELQHRLVTDGLGVKKLRLLMGTSMGCMHSWMWSEKWPRFMDATLALACLPVQIAGRNRMMRRMILDDLNADDLRGAMQMLFVMTSAPLVQQKAAPTRDEADQWIEQWMQKRTPGEDKDDMYYAFDASRDYDPSPGLEKIETRFLAINSADDMINPPELGILEREIKRVPHGRAVVLPIGPNTRGHGTHTNAVAWSNYLEELLRQTEVRR